MIDTIYAHDIDLLPGDVYNPAQGSWNSCQAYMQAVDEESSARRADPSSNLRACRSQVWWDAKRFSGGPEGNIGATFWSVARALQLFGMAHSSWSGGPYDAPTPEVVALAAANKLVFESVPYIRSGPSKDSAHETLAMLMQQGHFIHATLNVTGDFSRQSGVDGWTHDGSQNGYEHVVLIYGRDHAKRQYKALNPWGDGWANGGRFRIPYDKVEMGPQYCVTQLWYVKQRGIPPVGIPMMNPAPTSLTTDQQAAYFQRLRGILIDAFSRDADGNGEPDGWIGALNKAAELGVSDKLFELLAGLARFTVWDYVNRGVIAAPAGFVFEKTP